MSATNIPEWLTDEAIERTQALGHEMAVFLLRRDEAKLVDPDAKVEPHERLLELIAETKARCARSKPDSTNRT